MPRVYPFLSQAVPCDGEIVNLIDIGFNDERIPQVDPKALGVIGPIKGGGQLVSTRLVFRP